jgi:hypothetical protein
MVNRNSQQIRDFHQAPDLANVNRRKSVAEQLWPACKLQLSAVIRGGCGAKIQRGQSFQWCISNYWINPGNDDFLASKNHCFGTNYKRP